MTQKHSLNSFNINTNNFRSISFKYMNNLKYDKIKSSNCIKNKIINL